MNNKCDDCGKTVELHHPIISGKVGANPMIHDVIVDGKGNYVFIIRDGGVNNGTT